MPGATRSLDRIGRGRRMPSLMLLSCSAMVVLLAGCSENLPGEVVGAYRVTMRLEENSCGELGLPLADGYRYTAELREEEPRGFWRTPSAAPIEGRYQSGTFEFSFAMTLELGMADAGTAGCLVRREEQLRGTVSFEDAGAEDAGSADGGARAPRGGESALAGEHRISFIPDPNGRCANVRGPVHVFAQLPCGARYRIEGEPTKSF